MSQMQSFVKSPRVNEPERICSDDTQTDVVDAAIGQNNYDNLNLIFKVATIIRNETIGP